MSWLVEPELLEQAYALLATAPKHYQVLLLPVFLRAGKEWESMALVPFVRLMVNDPYFRHILQGGEAEPLLPEDEPVPSLAPEALINGPRGPQGWPAPNPAPALIALFAGRDTGVEEPEGGAMAYTAPGEDPEYVALQEEIAVLKAEAARYSADVFKMAQHYEKNAAILRQGLRERGFDPDELLRAAHREEAAALVDPVRGV